MQKWHVTTRLQNCWLNINSNYDKSCLFSDPLSVPFLRPKHSHPWWLSTERECWRPELPSQASSGDESHWNSISCKGSTGFTGFGTWKSHRSSGPVQRHCATRCKTPGQLFMGHQGFCTILAPPNFQEFGVCCRNQETGAMQFCLQGCSQNMSNPRKKDQHPCFNLPVVLEPFKQASFTAVIINGAWVQPAQTAEGFSGCGWWHGKTLNTESKFGVDNYKILITNIHDKIKNARVFTWCRAKESATCIQVLSFPVIWVPHHGKIRKACGGHHAPNLTLQCAG